MTQNQPSILIVEDEKLISEPLTRVLEKSGYQTKCVRDSNEALRELALKEYDLAILDCMLPKLNGIELAKKIHDTIDSEIKIVLMSGIFKDANFRKEALEKSKALEFFHKPFDLEDLVSLIDSVFKGNVPTLNWSQKYFNFDFIQSGFNSIPYINETRELNGLDLPILFSIIHLEKLTGSLTLNESGNLSVVQFFEGNIFQVQTNDTESYFGVLLIEHGFTTPEEVAKALTLDSQIPIGKKLWAINTISPHAIKIVHQEQLSIRLSKLIKPIHYQMNFEPNNHQTPDIVINNENYLKFLNDWLCSKIPTVWFSTFWAPFLQHHFVKGPNYNRLESLKRIALANLSPNMIQTVQNKDTLANVLENNKKPFINHSLLFMLLAGIIKFHYEEKTQLNYPAIIDRLLKLQSSLQGKNYYEVLGVDRYANKEKIQQSFHGIAVNLHPDKVPRDAPEQLLKLSTELFQVYSEANQTLSNPSARKSYDFELDHGKAEQIIEAESLYEKGLLLLQNKKYNEACEIFDKVYSLDMHNDDFFVHYAWALIKRNAPPSKKRIVGEFIDQLLSKIPQENRHNYIYFYVKGLFNKFMEDDDKAVIAFKHSFTLNPDFKPAQLEWMSIENKKSKNKDSADNFLGIFKKKSS